MLHLGQTLRKKGTDNLVLYMGWKDEEDDWIYIVSEAGSLNQITPSELYSKYSPVWDEFGKPVIGIHAKYGFYFGYYFDCWKDGESLKPDLNLRRYLHNDNEEKCIP